MVCLSIGGLSLISVALVSEKEMLLLSMVGVGIAWASILSMPYAILSHCLPPEKMGFFMGVFNFFIVLPQIVIAFGLGLLIGLIPQANALHVIIGAGFAMLVAALFVLRVRETSVEVQEVPA